MRTGSRSSDVIMYSSTHTVVNNDDIELVSIDRPSKSLAETNVKIHTAFRAPRDKTERHVRHDDCCGYCERYSMDKITHLKRREIEAWRQDVDKTMEAKKAMYVHKTKKPKLTFLKYSTIGKPDTDPGFRRIKTPQDVIRYPQNGGTNLNGRQSRRINVTDLWGKYSSGANGRDHVDYDPGFDRALDMLDSPAATDFSKDSLESGDSEDDESHEDEQTESSQHSYRSTSNKLLNVFTIDDAIKNHRDRLLRNNVLRTADPRRRKVASVIAPQLSLDGITIQDDASAGGEQEHVPDHFDTTEEFHLHPESEKGSRPVSKISALSVDGPVGDFRMRSSTRLQRSSESLEPHSRMKSGNYNVMLKAVDDGVTEGDVLAEKPSASKPQSKRFRKMNKNLRNLIDKEFLPDHRMAERLHYFSDDKKKRTPRDLTSTAHSSTSAVAKGRMGFPRSSDADYQRNHTPRSAGRVRDMKPSDRTDTPSNLAMARATVTKSETPVLSSGNQFLAMLADYPEDDSSGVVEQ